MKDETAESVKIKQIIHICMLSLYSEKDGYI